MAGDRILYAGEAGEVEFVIDGADPTDWYVKQFGPDGGIMLAVPSFGSLFVVDTTEEDELAYVSRGEPRARTK